MWRFKELADDEPERKPREAEFFQGLDIADSLVRESIQNSLDARVSNDSPVIVRFGFGQTPGVSSEYLADLIPHARSAGVPLPQEIPSGMPYLAIEDFNTGGLDGPLSRDETDGIKGNYLNFWWGEGESDKSGKNAGRWGLGKTVYHVASTLRAFFGLTVRASDHKALLLGKALLYPHRYDDGRRYNYFGYFADHSVKPFEGPALQSFKQTFSLAREAEPGLSVVVPMPVTDLTPESVVRSAIVHYFFPIISGDLTVRVEGNFGATTIESRSIYDLARHLDWNGSSWEDRDLDSLLTFLEEASNLTRSTVTLPLPRDIPRMTDVLEGDNLNTLRLAYQANKVLRVRIPLRIGLYGGDRKETFFEVFIERDERLRESDEFYIRSGITVTKIRMLRNRRVRALLSARDDVVSAFLGDSETPAHTDWEERNEVFRRKYDHAREVLRFIQSSMREIVKMLDNVPPGIDPDFLEGIFSVPKGVTQKPIIPDIVGAPSFTVERVKAGFRVSLADRSIALPVEKQVQVAYDTQKGNPFSRYSTLDFDFAGKILDVHVSGGKPTTRQGNRLVIRVEKQGFAARVTGFDENRDIVVSVR